jgi:hypothetical protein
MIRGDSMAESRGLDDLVNAMTHAKDALTRVLETKLSLSEIDNLTKNGVKGSMISGWINFLTQMIESVETMINEAENV